jgi:glycosyltransferase involved in cell wall biosynthesis
MSDWCSPIQGAGPASLSDIHKRESGDYLGLSCVICSHNGAGRIEQALRALQKQVFETKISWEVIVIDNASSDDTGSVAERIWSRFQTATPLTVVREEKLGLAFARERGLQEASHSIISYIDDDVSVCENWVEQASKIMTANPQCGALGGLGVGIFDTDPPGWFFRHQAAYVVGPQGDQAGDVTDTERTLWGAGLTVRVSAMLQLLEQGFRHILIGRQGAVLGCGEDTELSLALRLAGWRIFYESNMTYEHILPRERVNWSYLRRWYRGYGAASVGIDPYVLVRDQIDGNLDSLTQKAAWKIAASLFRLVRRPMVLIRALCADCEGDDSITQLEFEVGRLGQLLCSKSEYETNLRAVINAKWRKPTNTVKKFECE